MREFGRAVMDRRVVMWALLGLAGCAAIVLFVYDPAESVIFPPCVFHALTGLHCPGCGSLRGLHQLLGGNIVGALDLNPLMVLSLPFVGYGLMSECAKSLIGKRLPGFFMPAIWIWAILAIVITFSILRNVPVYPFTVLAP